jgi:hypothetical protein
MKKRNYIKSINEFITEKLDNKEIEIKKIEQDERSNKKSKSEYSVNYQITIDGILYEVDGILKSYNTGRDQEYEFEVGYFIDKESEKYWEDNWTDIEEEILEYFYNTKR